MESLPPSVVDKFKRVGVTLLTVVLIALNKKLGLDFETQEILGIASVVVGYVASGTWKSTVLERANKEAQARAAEIKSLPDALKVLANSSNGGAK